MPLTHSMNLKRDGCFWIIIVFFYTKESEQANKSGFESLAKLQSTFQVIRLLACCTLQFSMINEEAIFSVRTLHCSVM